MQDRSPTHGPAPEDPIRILMIEDDPDHRFLFQQALQMSYDTTIVATGTEGVALAGNGYDIVVTDLFLRDISGLEVIRQVKARLPDLPVVVLSALSRQRDQRSALEAGADGFIEKPISPSALATALSDAVRTERSPVE